MPSPTIIPNDPITIPLRVLYYACGDLAGMTHQETAEALGISVRQTYNDRERYEREIADMTARLAPVIRVNKREIRAVEKAKLMEEVERRLGMSLDTWDRAMEGGGELGYVAGKEVRDRLIGKPANTTNIHGNIAHQIAAEMTLILPMEAREALRVGISRDVGLLVSANKLSQGADVIDIEPSEPSDQS